MSDLDHNHAGGSDDYCHSDNNVGAGRTAGNATDRAATDRDTAGDNPLAGDELKALFGKCEKLMYGSKQILRVKKILRDPIASHREQDLARTALATHGTLVAVLQILLLMYRSFADGLKAFKESSQSSVATVKLLQQQADQLLTIFNVRGQQIDALISYLQLDSSPAAAAGVLDNSPDAAASNTKDSDHE